MKKTIIAFSVAGLLSACAGTGGHHVAHWGYEGEQGPNKWGMISGEFAMCGSGKAQSPIDISETAGAGNLKPIELTYTAIDNPTIVNNGHTIKVDYNNGSYATIGGKRFDLLQFHFHSPSEHTIGGKHADMVAHLVHKAADGQLAVVAILFDKGAENAALAPVFSAMPSSEGKTSLNGSLDVAAMIPTEDKGFYNYSGSLTTPPCSEGVNWNVVKARSSVSDAQVAAFTNMFPKSIRPVQAVHGRMISEL